MWQSMKARMREALLVLLSEARAALWQGAIIGLGLWPLLGGLIILATHRSFAWDVQLTRVLFFHAVFCLGVGSVTILLAFGHVLFRSLVFDEIIPQWLKACAGLAVVGLCELCAWTLVVTLYPRLHT